jgi:hypothetical protein
LKYVEKDKPSDFKTGSDVLKHWDDRPIPDSVLLELLYLAIFLSAESAFVLMALREYINDTRHISELEWMFGKQGGGLKVGWRAPHFLAERAI